MLLSDLFTHSSDAFMFGMLLCEVEIAQGFGDRDFPDFYAEPLWWLDPEKQQVMIT